MQLDNDDFAIIRFQGHLIVKLLSRKLQASLDRIYADFRAGRPGEIGPIAEYCALRDQINEIQSIMRTSPKENTNGKLSRNIPQP